MTTVLYQDFNFDEYTGSLIQMDSVHRMLHEGRVYVASKIFSAALNTTTDVLITTPATVAPHMTFSIGSTASPMTISIFEGSTVSGGSSVVPVNRNRITSNTSSVIVSHAVTTSATGSLLEQYLQTGDKHAGSSGGFEQEIIMKPGTNYLLRIFTTNAADIYYSLNWYETIS